MLAPRNKRKRVELDDDEDITGADSPSTSFSSPAAGGTVVASICASELRKWNIFKNLESSFLKAGVRLAHVCVPQEIETSLGFLVTTDDEVYAIGGNYNGAFGNGSEEPEESDVPVKIAALCGKSVTNLFVGGLYDLFYVALTAEGQLYTWGDNYYGQLGEVHNQNIFTPTFVQAMEGKRIVQVACGELHVLTLTDEGQVYSWGSNEFGRLGRTSHTSVPILVEEFSKLNVTISSIAVGIHHSCALSTEGKLYLWGSNKCGQLGYDNGSLPAPVKSSTPKAVPALKFQKVLSGGKHLVGLSADGGLYCWGDNEFDQLGMDEPNLKLQFTPKQLLGEAVEDIAVIPLGDVTVGKTETGKFIVWGRDMGKDGGNRVYFPAEAKTFHDVFRFYDPLCQTMHEPLTPVANGLKDVMEIFLLAAGTDSLLELQDYEKRLEEVMGVENAVEIYNFTSVAPAMKNLRVAAFKFIAANFKRIPTKSLGNLPAEELRKIVRQARE